MTYERAVADMKALYADYIVHWNRCDVPGVIRLFSFPWLANLATGMIVVAERGMHLSMLPQIFNDLKSQGWARTSTDRVDAHPMGDDIGLLEVDYVRYRADDSVLARGRAQYFARRDQSGWRFVAAMDPPARPEGAAFGSG